MKRLVLRVCEQRIGLFPLFVVMLFILPDTIVSCKKKDNQDQVTFPQTVYASDLANRTAIRMFIKGTEITDTAVIHKYIGDAKYFNQNGMDSSYYISFVSSDSATIAGYTHKFSYTLNGDLFLIYSRDFYEIDPMDHLSVLADTIQKYKTKKIPVPHGTNLATYIRYAIWVAHGTYNNLLLSIIAYKISTWGAYQMGTLPNEFFEGTLSALRTGDTVAVQSYSIRMVAR